MILDDLVAATRKRMERDTKRAPLEYMMERAESVRKTELAQAGKGAVDIGSVSFAFERNLSQPQMQFICEVKRHHRARGSLRNIFLMWKSQKNMKRRGRRPFLY